MSGGMIAILALIIACFSLSWNVGSWFFKRKEETAEKAKRPVLAVTLGNGTTTTEFYPIGGHAKQGVPISFTLLVENTGDAKAEHVVVTLELPGWAHPARLDPIRVPTHKPDNAVEWIELDDRNRDVIEFRTTGFRRRTGSGDVAMIVLPRPIYPAQRQEIGSVVITAPFDEPQRIDWIIESSGDETSSMETSAIYVTTHKTAVNHDPVGWQQVRDGTAICSYCQLAEQLGAAEVMRRLHEYGTLIPPREDAQGAPQRSS